MLDVDDKGLIYACGIPVGKLLFGFNVPEEREKIRQNGNIVALTAEMFVHLEVYNWLRNQPPGWTDTMVLLRVSRSARTLQKARNRVQGNWLQHSYSDAQSVVDLNTSKVCARGALRWARTGDPHRNLPRHGGAPQPEVEETLLETLLQGQALTVWNDAAGRTEEDVLFLFDVAFEVCMFALFEMLSAIEVAKSKQEDRP